MSAQTVTNRPWHLWIVAILALLWNSIGCLDFFMTQTENVAYFEKAGITAEQMGFFTAFPTWAVLLWGVAVCSPMVGVICLVLKKRIAVEVYLLGLVTYVAAMIRQYGFTEFTALFPETHYQVFSVVIFIIALGQLLYARAMKTRGVLS